jgi:hypothetical protein
MKKTTLLKFTRAAAFLTGALFICSTSFAQDRQERNLPAFTQLDVTGAVVVNLSQGESQRVVVIGGTDVQESIVTDVKDGVLRISQKKGTNKEARIEVTATEINSIKQGGATKVTGTGKLTAENFSIETMGASVGRFEVNAENLSTNISGAGDLKVNGTATNHTSRISGAGSLKAGELTTQNLDININGAGSARVNAIASINGQVNGAGSIKYVTEPERKNVEIRGAGTVSRAGESAADRGTQDTTRLRLGNSKVLVIPGEEKSSSDTLSRAKKEKKFKNRKAWAGIDLGVAGYLSPETSLGMRNEHRLFELDYRRSLMLNLNILEKRFKIVKHNVGLVTGLGFNYTSYSFRNRQTMFSANQDSTYLIQIPDISKKHNFNLWHVTVPLLIDFNTHRNPRKSFHFAAGVIGGYKLSSRSNLVLEQGNRTLDVNTRGDFNINPFRLDATARFGYGKLNLFVTYGLTPLFQQNRGPELTPVSAGLTLIGF